MSLKLFFFFAPSFTDLSRTLPLRAQPTAQAVAQSLQTSPATAGIGPACPVGETAAGQIASKARLPTADQIVPAADPAKRPEMARNVVLGKVYRWQG